MVAIVAISGISLAATAPAGTAPPRLYTVAATEACLKSLPDAIDGLPPANPPIPPALFVYSFSADRFPTRAHGQLGAWYGHKTKARFEGITLSFFKDVTDARTSLKSWPWLYGGKLIRNVVVAWAQSPIPRRSLRKTVLGCLRAGPAAAGTAAPKRSIPQASLATFVGHWGGHTRRLLIAPSGRGFEHVNSGCCVHVITLSFRLLRVKGTVTNATATFRVTSVKRGDWTSKRGPRVGQIGRLVLKNGIVTDTLTGIYYCSGPAWAATGACGA
jgi:hypothetical protein